MQETGIKLWRKSAYHSTCIVRVMYLSCALNCVFQCAWNKICASPAIHCHMTCRHYMSPLMYACQLGHTAIAEVLVSSSADINCQDVRGWTVSCVFG